ncbi:MAG: SOS response-associated peptidase [Bacteroidales bacterium]|nr:SOS response-associated peptidase [Bacteroidales bacterium]
MCYTIKIDLTREELERRFGARFNDPARYNPGSRISAFSLPLLPVISSDHPQDISLYYWGLIPYWMKDPEGAQRIRMKTFNARSESLAEKPSYRGLLNRKHCLVLTSGFYEWQTIGNEKIPYYIGVKDQRAFALAGLFDRWTNRETGEMVSTFTVITTRANPMMEEIHNVRKRMPVILHPGNEKRWLNTGGAEFLNDLFEPYPESQMFAERMDWKKNEDR